MNCPISAAALDGQGESSCALWLESQAAVEALARALALAGRGLGRLLITLDGDLGAGKTTFARAYLRALGVEGRIKSPTYALVEPYALADGRHAYHLDLYRIGDARELEPAGILDLLEADDEHDTAVLLVEWPERGSPLLPKPDLRIQLQADAGAAGSERRHLQLSAQGGKGLALLAAARAQAAAEGGA